MSACKFCGYAWPGSASGCSISGKSMVACRGRAFARVEKAESHLAETRVLALMQHETICALVQACGCQAPLLCPACCRGFDAIQEFELAK